MADNLDFWFKAGIFSSDGKSYSSVLPETGSLAIYQLAVKGGDKRSFYDEQATDNYMDLGSEIEQLKRYRNIGIVRKSDLYSVEFLEAKIARKKMSLGVSFKIRSGITTKALTQVVSYAFLKEFDHRIKNGERFDYMLFKLSEIEINYKHTITLRDDSADPDEIAGE